MGFLNWPSNIGTAKKKDLQQSREEKKQAYIQAHRQNISIVNSVVVMHVAIPDQIQFNLCVFAVVLTRMTTQ